MFLEIRFLNFTIVVLKQSLHYVHLYEILSCTTISKESEIGIYFNYFIIDIWSSIGLTQHVFQLFIMKFVNLLKNTILKSFTGKKNICTAHTHGILKLHTIKIKFFKYSRPELMKKLVFKY